MNKLLNFETSIFDNLYEGVYCIDMDEKIFYWNKSAEDITGYKACEVKGTSIWNKLIKFIGTNEKDYRFTDLPLFSTINQDLILDSIILIENKLDYTIPVSLRAEYIYDSHRNKVGVLIMLDPMTLVGELDHRIEVLENLAMVDTLTQIANRRYTEHVLKLRLEVFKEKNEKFSLLFVDIDRFKSINDTFGHSIGDIVLRECAKELKETICKDCFLGRWGGEEFVIISGKKTLEDLKLIGNILNKKIEKKEIVIGEKRLRVTVSIGGTVVGVEDTIDSIVDRADKNMYESKENGRNMVTIK